MNNIQEKYITVAEAKKIAEALKGKGLPAPGRILICSYKGLKQTSGGIYIPQNIDEKELPRKGVLIQANRPTDFSQEELAIGTLVTFGMYAGKEVFFNEQQLPGWLDINLEDYKFTVLSESEIVYIETNK